LLTLERAPSPGLQDCAAWRHLDGRHAPAIEHDEPATMAGAKNAGVFRERFDEPLDDRVFVDRVVLIPDVELVTAHESDP
jgi:hypothetical protein